MNKKTENIIRKGMTGIESAGGLLGFISTETSMIAEEWGIMKFSLAQSYGVTLDKQSCIKTCEGIVRCLSACKSGCKALIIGVSNLIDCSVKPALHDLNTIVNALLTYRIGKLYDNLYGPEKLGTRSPTFGFEIYKPILGVPSKKEFQEFLRIWNN